MSKLPRRGKMSITAGFNRRKRRTPTLFLAPTGRYKVTESSPRSCD
jgi:hypothetical protein